MSLCVKWTVPILLLYVFVRDFRPSEPFLTPYLVEVKNLSKTAVYNEIYPVWSYSQLPVFLVVMTTTDLMRYRPVIWFGALGYVATWLLLVFGFSVGLMELMQVTYAIGTGCEVAYKSYVFVAVPKSRYSTVSLYLSAASLLGKAVSSFSSQILHDYADISFLQLNYISLTSVSMALIISFCIPPPEKILVQEDLSPCDERTQPDSDVRSLPIKMWDVLRRNVRQIRDNLKLSCKSSQTRRWVFWGVVTTSIYFMVGNTAQSLWEDLGNGKDQKRYNGYVMATNALVSSLASFTLSRYSKQVEQTPGALIALMTLGIACTTLLPTIIQNLYLAYVCDTIFNILVSSSITISTFKIGYSLTTDLYGFVIGLIFCVAGLLDLLTTFIVADERVLGFSPRYQYMVYTGFSLLAAAMYGCYLVFKAGRRGLGSSFTYLLVEDADQADDEMLDVNLR